jgi:hypothetical protein
LLSGCVGGGITVKDATGFIAGQVISNANDSDAVIVTDARIKRNKITQPTTTTTKNWNSTAVPTTNTIPTNPPVQSQLTREDKTSTLFWFFFAMMAMGMLGAGIIGIIEAFSKRPINKD